MKKFFKWIFVKPAGRFSRIVFVRTGMMASLAVGLFAFLSCEKEPDIDVDGDDSVKIEAVGDEWGSGADTGLRPDMGKRTKVNMEHSVLPSGVEVAEDGTVIRLSHTEADFLIAVGGGSARPAPSACARLQNRDLLAGRQSFGISVQRGGSRRQ